MSAPSLRVAARIGAVYLPPQRTRAIVMAVNTTLDYSKPFWLGAGTITAAMIIFGTVNYGAKPRPHLQQQASLMPLMSARQVVQETVVYRGSEQRQTFQERWDQ